MIGKPLRTLGDDEVAEVEERLIEWLHQLSDATRVHACRGIVAACSYSGPISVIRTIGGAAVTGRSGTARWFAAKLYNMYGFSRVAGTASMRDTLVIDTSPLSRMTDLRILANLHYDKNDLPDEYRIEPHQTATHRHYRQRHVKPR